MWLFGGPFVCILPCFHSFLYPPPFSLPHSLTILSTNMESPTLFALLFLFSFALAANDVIKPDCPTCPQPPTGGGGGISLPPSLGGGGGGVVPGVGALAPVVGGVIGGAAPVVGGVTGTVTPVVSGVVGTVAPVVGGVVGGAAPVVGGVTGTVTPVVGGVTPTIGGAVDDVTPTAGGLVHPPAAPRGKPCLTPAPKTPKTEGAKCPLNTVKLGACADLLGGLVHIGADDPAANKCCPVIAGLAEVEAAACLCTTLQVKALNLDIFLPIALQLLLSCGKTLPPGFTCPV